MRKTMKRVSHQQARQLLHNKFIVVLGDSIQRSVYKDLVMLLQKEQYLSLRQLKTKGEMSFEQDSNGTEYREVRQFQTAHHLVCFYSVTRIYSRYTQSILDDLRRGLKPDVVIVNSCVWDISSMLRFLISSQPKVQQKVFPTDQRAIIMATVRTSLVIPPSSGFMNFENNPQPHPSHHKAAGAQRRQGRNAAAADSDAPESSESSSSQSDIIVIPPKRKMRKGNKLRVEILSLAFEPSSHVAMDKSVQRVYVEYRLLGIPMETTETPMSLRKPKTGEEIHYNFTRVIYVDGSQSAPLRQYLYTMLEGSDPNQGRLKFTVVSEPMDGDEECVDVGHAFLDLQELLLTGNDVSDKQIDIVSVDEDKEVIGNLKVSLEAAKALTGIYQEFLQKSESKKGDETDEEDEEEEEEEEQEKEGGKKI